MADISPWVNPMRSSLQGEYASTLNIIFDDLEKWLRNPSFPNGIVVGNGTDSAPSTTAAPVTSAGIGSVDTTPPSGPTGLTVTGAIQAVVAVWNANTESDLAGYEIQVSTSAGFTSPINRTSGGNTSLVSGLTFGTTYYVRVRAVDAAGNTSPWSSTQTGTPSQVGTSDIAANAVTAAVIAAGTITGDRIAGNTIEAGNLKAITIDAAGIKVGGIVSGTIAAGSIVGTQISAGSINADRIEAGTINATQIAVNGVGLAQIIDGSITGAKLASAVSIAAGNGIASSNYVAGTSGWRIRGDGYAEFANVDIRGSLVTNTTGARVEIGNPGFTDDAIRVYTNGGSTYGTIESGTYTDRIAMRSPTASGDQASIYLISGSAGGGYTSGVWADASVLTVSGDIRPGGSLYATYNVGGNQLIAGASGITSTGQVTANGGLQVTGAVNVFGSVAVSTNLSVSGALSCGSISPSTCVVSSYLYSPFAVISTVNVDTLQNSSGVSPWIQMSGAGGRFYFHWSGADLYAYVDGVGYRYLG